jgi:phosphoenolpyruvate synthase/pyruvate phosphate dikinase
MKKSLSVCFLVSAIVPTYTVYAADSQSNDQGKSAQEAWDWAASLARLASCSVRRAHVRTHNKFDFDIIAYVHGINLCKVALVHHNEPVFEVFEGEPVTINTHTEGTVEYIGRSTLHGQANTLDEAEKMLAHEINLVKPRLFWKSVDGTKNGVVDLDKAYKKAYDMKVVLKPGDIHVKHGFKDNAERIHVAKAHLKAAIETREARGEYAVAAVLTNYYREYYT